MELADRQPKHEEVVDGKEAILDRARPERDAWIRKYAAFKNPKK